MTRPQGKLAPLKPAWWKPRWFDLETLVNAMLALALLAFVYSSGFRQGARATADLVIEMMNEPNREASIINL